MEQEKGKSKRNILPHLAKVEKAMLWGLMLDFCAHVM
jgi:hypothetical protein